MTAMSVDTIALLRGINVGGHTVTMAVLKAELEALGLTEVQSVIASGNLAFHAGRTDRSKLTTSIEDHLRKQLGFAVGTFLRTPAQLAAVTTASPFDKPAAGSLQVGFLRAGSTADLQDLQTPHDELAVVGTELFWSAGKGVGRADLDLRALGKRLGELTLRSMTTVEKLAARFG
jgi:uncharacterized protein (DUF1697 family)